MIWHLDDLMKTARANAVLIDGTWVPARPYDGPWIWRLCAAWEVLRGRADAFRWPANQ